MKSIAVFLKLTRINYFSPLKNSLGEPGRQGILSHGVRKSASETHWGLLFLKKDIETER